MREAQLYFFFAILSKTQGILINETLEYFRKRLRLFLCARYKHISEPYDSFIILLLHFYFYKTLTSIYRNDFRKYFSYFFSHFWVVVY